MHRAARAVVVEAIEGQGPQDPQRDPLSGYGRDDEVDGSSASVADRLAGAASLVRGVLIEWRRLGPARATAEPGPRETIGQANGAELVDHRIQDVQRQPAQCAPGIRTSGQLLGLDERGLAGRAHEVEGLTASDEISERDMAAAWR